MLKSKFTRNHCICDHRKPERSILFDRLISAFIPCPGQAHFADLSSSHRYEECVFWVGIPNRPATIAARKRNSLLVDLSRQSQRTRAPVNTSRRGK